MSKNVPKLRFKGFEDEWKEYKLGDFSEKITEKNKGFKIENVISNSAKNGLISQRDFFEKDIANKNNIDGYYIIKNGDFVYNPRKSNEAPYGPINKYKFKDDGVVSPLYFCFRINNKVNNEYLEEYFKSSKWYKYVHMNSDQGARHDRVSIKDSEVMKMKIKLPSLEEEKKIANFLSKVDSIIEKQEKKVEYWNSYKKGMMQKIFKQEIRFKDDNGLDYPAWEERKFYEIVSKTKLGGNYENSEVKTNFPLIKMGNLGRGNIILNKIEYIQNDSIIYEDDILKQGDLLFNTRNTLDLVGKVAIWRCELEKAYYNSNLLKMEFKKSIISSNYFMNYLFNSHNIMEQLKAIATGTTSVAAIYTKDLNNVKFKLPVIEEQTKIANFLSNIDNIIEKENKKLEELKQLKKGLLQQMFV